jgi:hypothetical protein
MNGFLWAIVLGMFIMSIVLLMGKGSRLIAGYNTSSEGAKSKYDEKKLCHTMGGGLLIITILLTAMLFFNLDFSNKITEYIFIGVISIDALMMIILGNTVCKRK